MLISTSLLQVLALCSAVSLAHGTGSSTGKLVLPDPKYSLPDLLPLKSIPKNWNALDQTTLEEGRVILTPKQSSKGSLWLSSPVQLGKAFTIEWTVRSIKYAGQSNGGMALWFISSDNKKDNSFYNGPSKFNGLQLLIDNNGPLGQSIRGQLNDGTDTIDKQNVYKKAFASCLLGYQDASVPITIRLSYSSALESTTDYLLKLQIDNRVCFQTSKVKLPTDASANSGKYNIGVSADNGMTDESFEVLQMKYYDTVVEDVLIPNVNAMNQPKMIAKVVDKATGEQKIVDKEVLDAQNDHTSNYQLYKKLDKIEGKILANDIADLETKLATVLNNQITLTEQLNHLMEKLQLQVANNKKDGSDARATDEQFKAFYAMDEKLEKVVNDQAQIREATKHANQQQQVLQNTGVPIDEIVRKLTIWLIPLIAIMFIMAYYTFKIRQEIAKTKYL